MKQVIIVVSFHCFFLQAKYRCWPVFRKKSANKGTFPVYDDGNVTSNYQGYAGLQCKDIDECVEQEQVLCGQNQKCFNTEGSFGCNCVDGYQKNGTEGTEI